MRKSAILFLFLLLAGALPLLPCDVTAETKPAKEKGKIEVKLFVDCVHRSCPLAIQETKLETEGLKIEKQGEWTPVEERFYQLDLVVSLTEKEGGAIRVIRECPRRGTQEEIIKIKPL